MKIRVSFSLLLVTICWLLCPVLVHAENSEKSEAQTVCESSLTAASGEMWAIDAVDI